MPPIRLPVGPAATAVMAGLALLLLVGGACRPDPSHALALRLAQDLADGRAALLREPPDLGSGCDTAGEVRARLYVDAGPAGAPSAWPSLRQATDALLAACGRLRLLSEPSNGSFALEAARAAWEEGARRDLAEVCRYTTAARASLRVARPSCE